MLEKTPRTLGRAAQNLRAGAEDLAIAHTELTGVNASIEVSSPAFGYNEPIPSQYTADGDGSWPPLEWQGVPMNAEAVVVLIEDADSPTPRPLVHAIVWDLPGSDASLPEGSLPSRRADENPAADHLGRNSALSASWLPPDPPTGHGPHRYVFQVFALDTVPRFESHPGRAELLEKIKGHVIAKGLLIGTYERK
jgi:Raf kinase inhibitor-like YbhB/YbcL family protein